MQVHDIEFCRTRSCSLGSVTCGQTEMTKVKRAFQNKFQNGMEDLCQVLPLLYPVISPFRLSRIVVVVLLAVINSQTSVFS